MNETNAMALALAICGGVATYAFLEFGGPLSLWAAFVAWASFFHSGGDTNALKTGIASSLFGCLLGAATMYFITGTTAGESLGLPVWAGIVVFASAGLAVLAGKVALLSTVPVTMHALACVAAYVLLNDAGGAKLYSGSFEDSAFLNVFASMVIGHGCGVITGRLAGLLMGPSGIDLTTDQQTSAQTAA